MSSIINHIIPQQGYELIRDRVGNILKDELANQFTTFGVTQAKAIVVTEGLSVVDNTEMSKIIISLSEGTYDNQHIGCATAPYRFNIDVFCKSKSSVTGEGSELAAFKLHRLIGICRAILADPLYYTLGFTPGFIERSLVVGIKIGESDPKDMLNTIGGRLTLDVQVTEDAAMSIGVLVGGLNSKITIEETTKNYEFNTVYP